MLGLIVGGVIVMPQSTALGIAGVGLGVVGLAAFESGYWLLRRSS
jgi:hypothetical protein